jgi:predicted phage tail protein
MLRKIFIHGSLKKASHISEMTLDVDQQNQLFAALRARSTRLDLALRKHREIAIWTTDIYGENAEPVEQGFNFGKAPHIHICPHTEGSAFIPLVVWAVVAAVVVSVATSMLMAHTTSGANGAGGSKSTMFNGIQNGTDQGGAIPIVQGKRVLVGSTIIASAEDYVNLI